MSDLDELLTTDEVAELLRLPPSTVAGYARSGTMPSLKLGRHRRFVRSDVEAWLADLGGGTSRRRRTTGEAT